MGGLGPRPPWAPPAQGGSGREGGGGGRAREGTQAAFGATDPFSALVGGETDWPGLDDWLLA